jgi:hypothetical protein
MDEIMRPSLSWLHELAVATEPFALTNGIQCNVRKVNLQFKRWTRPVLFDTYNGKPIVEHSGRPMFAELAIVEVLKGHGYEAAWVDSYRNKFWQAMPSTNTNIALTGNLDRAYNQIKAINGRRGGCWDVIANRGDEFIFAELKLTTKDRIRSNQVRWLESAVAAGYKPEQFIIVDLRYH